MPVPAAVAAQAQTQTQAQASVPNAIRHADEEALARAIPNSADAGIFRIVNFEELAKASNSQRLAPYVNIGNDRLEWNCNRSALPSYSPRHSRRELKELAAKNSSALAKIGKKLSKEKSLSSPLKVAKSVKPSVSQSQTTQNVKPDVELSSEEEDSSSDDEDSEYSDDDEDDSPLPSKKPEDLKGSIEYDTIKALWRSTRKEISAESFRGALVDFWEIVKTIRDRWKTDSTALAEAEEKKRTGELPLLRSRVKDQRDLIEVAFRTALKHGHRGVVELLAENQSLVFVCFQFLLDRHKADDLNGPVTRAILETMSTFTTLTEEKLEKTRLNKLFPMYLKKGDAKTQFWVKKIKQNAVTATKNASTKDGASKKPNESAGKTTTAEASEKVGSPPTKRAEPVAGVKRAATTNADTNPTKKAATGAAKTAPSAGTTTTKVSSVVKKPSTGAINTATTSGNATAQRKTVPAKPSGFFSSLQSAAKKPGTSIADKPSSGTADRTNGVRPTSGAGAPPPKPAFSFAETMAKLSMPKEEKPAPKPEKEVPNETPEARAKRLRKEERRKLHVRFKSDAELVQIRLFTHDPEEETHHDASQVRDVSDVGGEGRMFKQQHQMMDLDDEDEAPEEDGTLIAFSEPSLIDFSVVDIEERRRNYAPYGGGELTPQSPERAERERYENGTLMAVYATPGDIPPDPREPANPYSGDLNASPQSFGAPEEKYIARARAKRARMNPHVPAPPSGFDFGALASLMSRPQQHAPPPPVAPPVTTPGVPDIEKILATLRQGGIGAGQPSNAPGPQPPAPSMPYNGFVPAAQPPNPPPSAPAVANPVAGLDLGAILAALQKNPIPGNGSGPQGPSSNAQANIHNDDDVEEVKARHPFYKTKACRFWQEGRCQKGASCSYLHE